MSLLRSLSGIVLLTALGVFGCGELDEEAEPPAERVGAARQAVVQLGDEVRASLPGLPAHSTSAGWIRSAELSNGHALLGSTQDGVAIWSYAADWTTSAPTYEVHRSDEPAPFGWPEPDNFCAVYACGGGETWKAYNSVEQVVWTGLDDVAAVVAIGAPNVGLNLTDLTVVTSTNGGQTFEHATVLSLPAPEGDSGGRIVPGSVHASLRYSRDRAGADAGLTSLPIYVVWQNELEGRTWWMTRFVVGVDGLATQLSLPVKVSVIPPSSASHASILGHDDGAAGEVVRLFWSLRTDGGGNPAFGPDCPSNETIQVQWLSSWTSDFGQSWGCTPPSPGGFCQDQTWMIDEDPTWRPCVGASFSESPEAPPYGVNNDRPEIAMNENGDPVWYMAVNKTKGPDTVTRVVVWMSLFGSAWQVAYESPATDLNDKEVGDAWAQSLAIQQGARLEWVPPVWQSAVLGLIWRTADQDGLITMNAASSADGFGLPGFWQPSLLAVGQGVPWSMTDEMGIYTGIAPLELCVNEPCPGGAPAKFPRNPFLAAWIDNRSPGAVSEVWATAFIHEE